MFGVSYGVTWGAGGQAPDAQAALFDVQSRARTDSTQRPELALAPGPLTMGQLGDGSLATLFGRNWALAWEQDGLQLYRQADTWEPITPGQAFPTFGPDVRHITLAFDQTAHHVFAYEQGAQVRVRQYSVATGDYVYQGPFAGVDPVLMMDGPLTHDLTVSDVLLFYLSADRTRLCYRAQRDLYGVEYTLDSGLSGAVLDQVAQLDSFYELLGENAGVETVWRSSLYPARLQVAQAAAVAGPAGGHRDDVVNVRDVGPLPVAAAVAGPAAGSLLTVVLTQALPALQRVAAVSGPADGTLATVVLVQTLPALVRAAVVSPPSAGALTTVVVAYTAPVTPLTAAVAGPSGGALTYA